MMVYNAPAPRQVFTVQAPTYQEAVDKARRIYGERVQVVQHRDIRYGGFLGFFRREGVELTLYLSNLGLRRQPPQQPLDLEKEKEKFRVLSPPRQDETLKEVLKEVQSLSEKLGATQAASSQKENHPSIEKISGLLYDNDFSPAYVRRITERLKKEFSLEALEDFDALQDAVIDWIGESISLYDAQKLRKSQVYILVGPTGVGKTTTIAKLAAMYGVVAAQPLDVRILTIDDFRIGAKEQIEKYGDIMRIPVACVKTTQDFKKYLSLYTDVDMILVDTVGKSPRDFVNLGEMRELLDAAFKKAGVHLALSATTKTIDLIEIMQQFEPFGYESLVITKLDETPRIGSVISAAAEKGKALSFITDGQKVPETIKTATVSQLLLRLAGFRVRRDHIEEKFGEKGM
ncbi:MAG: flagellar biosynthesis protein FlhF [Spirochaetales bacterium]|jgi:flagellar biosynthesis protein FlhF|nr:flagellar biosynthesis protein FlhF [Spirochaetales bacterium]